MKKYSLWATLFAVALLVGVGCGSDKTEVAWVHGAADGSTINNIVWNDSNGNKNASWSETITANQETGFKEITEVNGGGECSHNGVAKAIWVDADGNGTPETSWTVDEGSSTKYTIKKAE